MTCAKARNTVDSNQDFVSGSWVSEKAEKAILRDAERLRTEGQNEEALATVNRLLNAEKHAHRSHLRSAALLSCELCNGLTSRFINERCVAKAFQHAKQSQHVIEHFAPPVNEADGTNIAAAPWLRVRFDCAFNFAELFRTCNETDSALTALQECVNIQDLMRNPCDPEAVHVCLAETLLLAGEYDAAARASQRAIDILRSQIQFNNNQRTAFSLIFALSLRQLALATIGDKGARLCYPEARLLSNNSMGKSGQALLLKMREIHKSLRFGQTLAGAAPVLEQLQQSSERNRTPSCDLTKSHEVDIEFFGFEKQPATDQTCFSSSQVGHDQHATEVAKGVADSSSQHSISSPELGLLSHNDGPHVAWASPDSKQSGSSQRGRHSARLMQMLNESRLQAKLDNFTNSPEKQRGADPNRAVDFWRAQRHANIPKQQNRPASAPGCRPRKQRRDEAHNRKVVGRSCEAFHEAPEHAAPHSPSVFQNSLKCRPSSAGPAHSGHTLLLQDHKEVGSFPRVQGVNDEDEVISICSSSPCLSIKERSEIGDQLLTTGTGKLASDSKAWRNGSDASRAQEVAIKSSGHFAVSSQLREYQKVCKFHPIPAAGSAASPELVPGTRSQVRTWSNPSAIALQLSGSHAKQSKVRDIELVLKVSEAEERVQDTVSPNDFSETTLAQPAETGAPLQTKVDQLEQYVLALQTECSQLKSLLGENFPSSPKELTDSDHCPANNSTDTHEVVASQTAFSEPQFESDDVVAQNSETQADAQPAVYSQAKQDGEAKTMKELCEQISSAVASQSFAQSSAEMFADSISSDSQNVLEICEGAPPHAPSCTNSSPRSGPEKKLNMTQETEVVKGAPPHAPSCTNSSPRSGPEKNLNVTQETGAVEGTSPPNFSPRVEHQSKARNRPKLFATEPTSKSNSQQSEQKACGVAPPPPPSPVFSDKPPPPPTSPVCPIDHKHSCSTPQPPSSTSCFVHVGVTGTEKFSAKPPPPQSPQRSGTEKFSAKPPPPQSPQWSARAQTSPDPSCAKPPPPQTPQRSGRSSSPCFAGTPSVDQAHELKAHGGIYHVEIPVAECPENRNDFASPPIQDHKPEENKASPLASMKQCLYEWIKNDEVGFHEFLSTLEVQPPMSMNSASHDHPLSQSSNASMDLKLSGSQKDLASAHDESITSLNNMVEEEMQQSSSSPAVSSSPILQNGPVTQRETREVFESGPWAHSETREVFESGPWALVTQRETRIESPKTQPYSIEEQVSAVAQAQPFGEEVGDHCELEVLKLCEDTERLISLLQTTACESVDKPPEISSSDDRPQTTVCESVDKSLEISSGDGWHQDRDGKIANKAFLHKIAAYPLEQEHLRICARPCPSVGQEQKQKSVAAIKHEEYPAIEEHPAHTAEELPREMLAQANVTRINEGVSAFELTEETSADDKFNIPVQEETLPSQKLVASTKREECPNSEEHPTHAFAEPLREMQEEVNEVVSTETIAKLREMLAESIATDDRLNTQLKEKESSQAQLQEETPPSQKLVAEEPIEKAKAEEEAAATAKAEEEAVEKAKAQEEATAKTKAEEEAVEKAKAEEEAAFKAKAEEEAVEKAKVEEEAVAKAKAEDEAVEKAKAEEEAAAKAKPEEEPVEKAKFEEEAAAKAKAEEEAVEKAKAEEEAAANAKEEIAMSPQAPLENEERMLDLREDSHANGIVVVRCDQMNEAFQVRMHVYRSAAKNLEQERPMDLHQPVPRKLKETSSEHQEVSKDARSIISVKDQAPGETELKVDASGHEELVTSICEGTVVNQGLSEDALQAMSQLRTDVPNGMIAEYFSQLQEVAAASAIQFCRTNSIIAIEQVMKLEEEVSAAVVQVRMHVYKSAASKLGDVQFEERCIDNHEGVSSELKEPFPVQLELIATGEEKCLHEMNFKDEVSKDEKSIASVMDEASGETELNVRAPGHEQVITSFHPGITVNEDMLNLNSGAQGSGSGHEQMSTSFHPGITVNEDMLAEALQVMIQVYKNVSKSMRFKEAVAVPSAVRLYVRKITEKVIDEQICRIKEEALQVRMQVYSNVSKRMNGEQVARIEEEVAAATADQLVIHKQVTMLENEVEESAVRLGMINDGLDEDTSHTCDHRPQEKEEEETLLPEEEEEETLLPEEETLLPDFHFTVKIEKHKLDCFAGFDLEWDATGMLQVQRVKGTTFENWNIEQMGTKEEQQVIPGDYVVSVNSVMTEDVPRMIEVADVLHMRILRKGLDPRGILCNLDHNVHEFPVFYNVCDLCKGTGTRFRCNEKNCDYDLCTKCAVPQSKRAARKRKQERMRNTVDAQLNIQTPGHEKKHTSREGAKFYNEELSAAALQVRIQVYTNVSKKAIAEATLKELATQPTLLNIGLGFDEAPLKVVREDVYQWLIQENGEQDDDVVDTVDNDAGMSAQSTGEKGKGPYLSPNKMNDVFALLESGEQSNDVSFEEDTSTKVKSSAPAPQIDKGSIEDSRCGIAIPAALAPMPPSLSATRSSQSFDGSASFEFDEDALEALLTVFDTLDGSSGDSGEVTKSSSGWLAAHLESKSSLKGARNASSEQPLVAPQEAKRVEPQTKEAKRVEPQTKEAKRVESKVDSSVDVPQQLPTKHQIQDASRPSRPSSAPAVRGCMWALTLDADEVVPSPAMRQNRFEAQWRGPRCAESPRPAVPKALVVRDGSTREKPKGPPGLPKVAQAPCFPRISALEA